MNESSNQSLPKEFLDKLNSITNKRARVVIDHILKHGSVSTEELKGLYGYNHPPRAAKDVRDEGIPLVTFTIKAADGRSIAACRFGDPALLVGGREGGRKAFSKRFKRQLYQQCEGRCAICHGKFELRELQVDHRVPYEIGGDIAPDQQSEAYMLVCGSCNRAKSWSCEHCENWLIKDISMCQKCYWANPLDYDHVAIKNVRRTDLMWEGKEVELHDQVRKSAEVQNISIQDYIKNILKKYHIHCNYLNFDCDCLAH
jgi:hypothetical protein